MGRAELMRAVDAALKPFAGSCATCGGVRKDGPLALFLPPGEPERRCPSCACRLDQWNRPVGHLQADGSVHMQIIQIAPPDYWGPDGWKPELGPRPPFLPPLT